METKRVRVLMIKILKTIDNINPSYMKNIFISEVNAKVRPNDAAVHAWI